MQFMEMRYLSPLEQICIEMMANYLSL
jgi:hypothetical protein